MIDWGAMLPAGERPGDAIQELATQPIMHDEQPPAIERLPGISSYERGGDNRRRCSECAKLGHGGRCLAAVRREIVASRTYAPHPDLLRRCEAFAPLHSDPDQRPGRDRWPGL